eukprot:8378840-Pyramimonas_sp.AAC.1
MLIERLRAFVDENLTWVSDVRWGLELETDQFYREYHVPPDVNTLVRCDRMPGLHVNSVVPARADVGE